MRTLGIDFTSRPTARKPLTCAVATLEGARLRLDDLCAWNAFADFEQALAGDGPWLAAIDFPFGLPTAFVQGVHWPRRWRDYVGCLAAFDRCGWKNKVKAFKAPRPEGAKDLKRIVDKRAGSASPLNVNRPPVGLMLFEGAPRLLRSGTRIVPMLNAGDRDRKRIVVEAYPALVARKWIGNGSYKDGPPADATARRELRARVLNALAEAKAERYYGFRVKVPDPFRDRMIADSGGDFLDSCLAAVQGAWAWTRRERNFGMPAECDAEEGWIADPAVCDRQ